MLAAVLWAAKKKPADPPATPLDRYVARGGGTFRRSLPSTAGSIWIPAPGSPMPRATSAPASSTTSSPSSWRSRPPPSRSGTTKTQRTSSAKNSVAAACRTYQGARPAGEPRGIIAATRSLPARAPPAGHHPQHYLDRPRGSRAAQRRAGRRGRQGHPDQFRAPDHHGARRGAPADIDAGNSVQLQPPGPDSRSASTARASSAMRSAARSFSIACSSACCPSDHETSLSSPLDAVCRARRLPRG